MRIGSLKFRGHRCFKSEWSGFEEIKPVNVIIGRNNTGKSHLLELVRLMCGDNLTGKTCEFYANGTLSEDALTRVFPKNTSQGILRGNHWQEHGQILSGADVSWQLNKGGSVQHLKFLNGFDYHSRYGDDSTAERLKLVTSAVARAQPPLKGKLFRHLLADRDIQPEKDEVDLCLGPNGRGASNIIRRYILSSSADYPRSLIQEELLQALNAIFGSDGEFSEIQIQLHDDDSSGYSEKNIWEIFLGEEKKGLVPLSSSGSGLKTVFLVLLNLLVVPEMEGKTKRAGYVFAFEELENNLHPALLRRLLQYLETYAVRESAPVFLTTHSSTALDLFGVSKHSQIIHVTHDGESARAATVCAHFDKLGVVSELGAKPSDLLQANGIIWVEGPSDMIYMNRWLDIYTDGRLQEGRDYQCAFYGGSLLARSQFKSPEDAEEEFFNLLQVNPNIIVICDSDKTGPKRRVKDRVRRIRKEVMDIPGAHIWITAAREIENYLPGKAMSSAQSRSTNLRDPDQFESFFPKAGAAGSSYMETQLNRKTLDKTEFAILCAPHLTLEAMDPRFDWADQMKKIVKRVEVWNKF